MFETIVYLSKKIFVKKKEGDEFSLTHFKHDSQKKLCFE